MMLNHLKRGMGKALLTIAVAAGLTAAAHAGGPVSCSTVSLDFTGTQVVPANISTGSGQGLLEIDTVNNKIHGLLLISPTGTETGVALYTGAADANGTMVVALPADPVKFWTYAYDEAIEADLLAGNAYVQLASDTFPDGELRANFTNQTPCAPLEPCLSYEFALDGDNVTPGPVTTNAKGLAKLTLNTSSLTIDYDITTTDLVGETSGVIEGYHFPGLAATGDILVNLPLGDHKIGSFQITADQLFFVKLGAVRITLRTKGNPTGEIGAPFSGPSACATPSPTVSPTDTPTATETETPTATPSPTETPADNRPAGDFDNSGCTDLTDFLFLLDYWNLDSPIGGDPIGLPDFLSLLDFWNLGPNC